MKDRKAYAVAMCGELNDREFDEYELAVRFAKRAVQSGNTKWSVVIRTYDGMVLDGFEVKEGEEHETE